jgi:hypothetical protein
MKTYRIRYQHTSAATATSKAAALRMVRRELGVARLAIAECSDGTYIWATAAEKASDDTGANAAAVVESPAQQGQHC